MSVSIERSAVEADKAKGRTRFAGTLRSGTGKRNERSCVLGCSAPQARLREMSRAALVRFGDHVFSAQHKRVTLRFAAYDKTIIEPIVHRIADNARMCVDLKVSGPIYMPTYLRKITVLKSPFIDKKSREQFEMQSHRRLIIIEGPAPVVDKYLVYFENEEAEPGVEIKVIEQTYHNIKDFYAPRVLVNETFKDDFRKIQSILRHIRHKAPIHLTRQEKLVQDMSIVAELLQRQEIDERTGEPLQKTASEVRVYERFKKEIEAFRSIMNNRSATAQDTTSA